MTIVRLVIRTIASTLTGLAAPAAVALALASCALRPPVQNSGPAVSREGVAVAVTRQGCTQTVEPDEPGNDLVEAVLEVQVRNATSAPLTVHRDAFRLVTPDGYALETATFGAVDPLVLASGENRTFELRYMTRGSLQCSREMTLVAASGITLRDRAVEIGAVRIVPRRAL
jgi:hypothetical protein